VPAGGELLVSRIFISHSSIDNAPAIALRDWLVGEGWDDLFTQGLVAFALVETYDPGWRCVVSDFSTCFDPKCYALLASQMPALLEYARLAQSCWAWSLDARP